MKWILLFLVGGLLISESQAKVFRSDFGADLEQWTSLRGKWHWSDHDSLGTILPASTDGGFAVLEASYDSDELTSHKFSVPSGANFTISFYIRSEYTGSNTFQVFLINKAGQAGLFLDLSPYSFTYTKEWFTVSKVIPPAQEISVGIFCYNGAQAAAGQPMRGCAIDYIVFDTFGDATQPTTAATLAPSTAGPTFASSVETTETEIHSPTTTAYSTIRTSVDPSEVTTVNPSEVTTANPTVVTTANPTVVTTANPTAVTTANPTEVTTSNPTVVTTPKPTEKPQGNLVYDFQSSTNGWSLSLMNGASWKRVTFGDQGRPVGPPPHGPWVLQVFPELVQTGKVLAQSPLLEVTESRVKVTVTFWLDGTFDFPSRLTVRRRYDFSTFDAKPVIDMSPFGDQQNQQWITYSTFISDAKVGDQFSLTLEGSLGGHPNNSVAVHRMVVEGAKEADVDPSSFFSFEKGLSGWTPGAMNGGRWVLLNWNNTSPGIGIPQPSDGTNFLFVQRYDIFSGVISLESPRLELPPGYVRKLILKFWMRGTVADPVALRFRVKGNEGNYSEVPFLNLEHYGDTAYPMWIQLQKEYYIPTESTDRYFQLVIEADLGSDMNNSVAVDDIRVTSEKI